MVGFARQIRSFSSYHRKLQYSTPPQYFQSRISSSHKSQPPQGPKPYTEVAGLSVPLLPYQKEGVYWLVERENDPSTNGGVLADEMGMGKTLQMIALAVQQNKSPSLVVCPTAAVLQWRNEIVRFVGDKKVEVRIYHGANRKRLLKGISVAGEDGEVDGDT